MPMCPICNEFNKEEGFIDGRGYSHNGIRNTNRLGVRLRKCVHCKGIYVTWEDTMERLEELAVKASKREMLENGYSD